MERIYVKKVKNILKLLLVTLILIGGFNLLSYQFEVNAYNENIKNTVPISSKELTQKISNLEKNEEIFVYVGRPSCPYCREYSEELRQAIEETHQKVYYLESREDDKDQILEDFRDKYNIEYVPSILKIDKISFQIMDMETNNTIDFLSDN